MDRSITRPVLLLSLLVLVPFSAQAITVEVSSDVVASADGVCTLREALNNANADLDTTGGDCEPGVGADVITFLPQTDGSPITLLGPAGDDLNVSGDLDILDDDPLTIVGNGPGVTIIQGGVTMDDGVDRIFEIGIRVPVVIFEGLTIQNGRPDLMTGRAGAILALQPDDLQMTISNCDISHNQADWPGGVYFASTNGSLIIDSTTFSDNHSASQVASGGALRFISSAGTLLITDSLFTGNTADDGPGIDFDALNGVAVIIDTTVDGNFAGSDGGGIRMASTDGSMLLDSSSVTNNTAGRHGGGVLARATNGQLVIANSTISGNSAARSGGGISVGQDLGGNEGTVLALFSTIAHNTADADNDGTGDGGGIGHFTGTVQLDSTILANNQDSGGQAPNCSGVIQNSLGHNLIQSIDTCAFTTDPATDLVGVDAGLMPLGNNGGPTQTHALNPDSLAINNGAPLCTDAPVSNLDQRGVGRDPLCDIGAYESEFQGVMPTIPTLSRVGLCVLLLLLIGLGSLKLRKFEQQGSR